MYYHRPMYYLMSPIILSIFNTYQYDLKVYKENKLFVSISSPFNIRIVNKQPNMGVGGQGHGLQNFDGNVMDLDID